MSSSNRVEFVNKYAKLTPEGPVNTRTSDDYLNSGMSTIEDVEINITRLTTDKLEFDLVGADPPVANGLRRTMISDVPTVAIESVSMEQNTGALHDELIAQRLGLIPILCDINFLKRVASNDEQFFFPDYSYKFSLDVCCPQLTPEVTVYARDLVFQPQNEDQETAVSNGTMRPPQASHPDIMITRLRPGQVLKLECFAVVGVGKDHAKFSPVATAFYRLLPVIKFNQLITGEDARRICGVCQPGVYSVDSESRITAKNPRKCTTCRLCIEDPVGGKDIQLMKKKDHFLFTVESSGSMAAPDILVSAFDVIIDKCQAFLEELS